MKPIVIKDHAREAMQLRRISKDEVMEAIRNPETTDRDASGSKRYFRGKICVVTRDSGFRTYVRTVLYRYGDQWTDSDVRQRDFQ